MTENKTPKFGNWILISALLLCLAVVAVTFLFPQVITKLTGLIVGLLAIVTGLFLRRRK